MRLSMPVLGIPSGQQATGGAVVYGPKVLGAPGFPAMSSQAATTVS